MDATRVLVVDDEPSFLEVVSTSLELDGLEVITATGGQEALRLALTTLPDVILLDYCLGGELDGIAVCQQLKRSEGAVSSIPVLFWSGIDDIEIQCRTMVEAHAEGFIPKLTDLRLLSAQVQALARVRRRELALERRAQHDHLTGLPNNAQLWRLLHEEFRRASEVCGRLACLMLDVDHFKAINDTYGHPVGNEILRQISSRLRAGLRRHDFLGRYGGEEFTAILPGAGLREAIDVAERLRNLACTEPFPVEDHSPISLSISIGVSVVEPPDEDAEALLHRADQALLQAKGSGRNRVCWKVSGDLAQTVPRNL